VASQIHRDYADALKSCMQEETSRQYGWNKILGAGRQAVSARTSEYIDALDVRGLVE